MTRRGIEPRSPGPLANIPMSGTYLGDDNYSVYDIKTGNAYMFEQNSGFIKKNILQDCHWVLSFDRGQGAL